MTVAVIGLGLVGGSLALDLVARGEPVVATDLDGETRRRAAASGIPVVDGIAQASWADVVVVAVPPAAVAEVLTAVAGTAPGAVVTDVTSVKTPRALGFDPADLDVVFVGGHPMAGTERSGFPAARRGLLAGAPWLLTVGDSVPSTAFAAVLDLVLSVGASPVVVDPDEHDRLVAAVSHVPHLLAFAANAVAGGRGPDVIDLVAGPSFRDATRVAASDPGFWADVVRRNLAAVAAVLADVEQWLDGALADASASEPTTDPLVDRLAAARRTPRHGHPDRRTVSFEELTGVLVELRDLGRQGYAITAVRRRGARTEVDLARR